MKIKKVTALHLRWQLVFASLLFMPFGLHATTYYWSSTSPSTWQTSGSWSLAGGTPTTAIPGAGDIAIFDDPGTGNCDLSAAVSVDEIQINGYNATLNCATYTVTIKTNLDLQSGTFDSPAAPGYLVIRNNLNYKNTCTFQHNSGEVRFDQSQSGATNNITGDALSLWDMTFVPAGNSITNFQAGLIVTVENDLTFSAVNRKVRLVGGEIAVKGDIYAHNTFNTGGSHLGTTTINICGSGVQTWDGGSTIDRQGNLTEVKITNKGQHELRLVGNVGVERRLESVNSHDEVIDPNYAHTMVIRGTSGNGNWVHIVGNFTFDNLSWFPGTNNSHALYGGTITVNNLLSYLGAALIRINDGTINAKGDIHAYNTFNASTTFGTAIVKINGSGVQTWDGGSTSIVQGLLTSVYVENKSANELVLINNVGVQTRLENSSSSSDVIDQTSSHVMMFAGNSGGGNFDFVGPFTFDNLTIKPNVNKQHFLNSSPLVVINDLRFESHMLLAIHNGTIQVQGDFYALNTNNSGSSVGSAIVSLEGTGLQTIHGIGYEKVGRLPNLTINKPSGTVEIDRYITIDGQLNLLQGIIYKANNLPTDLIILNTAATVANASNLSYVNGPIKKLGNSGIIFPVGKGGKYVPIEISAVSDPTAAFTAEYFNDGTSDITTTSGYPVTSAASTLGAVRDCEFWNLHRNASAATAVVTLHWNSDNCDITGDLNKLSVARWGNPSPADWKNEGSSGLTGNSSQGSISSAFAVTEFDNSIGNVFTIASSELFISYASTLESLDKGGSIAVSVTGGVPPYSVVWNNNIPDATAFANFQTDLANGIFSGYTVDLLNWTYDEFLQNQTEMQRIDLGAGDYSLEIRDASGNTPSNLEIALGHEIDYQNLVGATYLNRSMVKNVTDGWSNMSIEYFNGLQANEDGWIDFEAGDNISLQAIGMTPATEPDPDYSKMSFAFYLDQGTIKAVESGTVSGSLGTYQTGDRFRLERTGTTINYYHNGSIIRTGTATASAIRFNIDQYSQNARVNEITSNGRPNYSPLIINTEIDMICGGHAPGYLEVQGGVPNYFTYNWSNGITTATNPNLTVGTYTVTLTDPNNYTFVYSYDIDYKVAWSNLNYTTTPDPSTNVLQQDQSTTSGMTAFGEGLNGLADGTSGFASFVIDSDYGPASNWGVRYGLMNLNTGDYDYSVQAVKVNGMNLFVLFYQNGPSNFFNGMGLAYEGDRIKFDLDASTGQISYYRNNSLIYQHTPLVSAGDRIIKANLLELNNAIVEARTSFDCGLNRPKPYGILAKRLNGTFYNFTDGEVRFKRREEYMTDGSDKLDYRIYRIDNNQLAVASDASLNPQHVGPTIDNNYGYNWHTIPIHSFSLSGGFYRLEVVDQKGDKTYLKFKY